jgi:AhpD family alkylhydroperoxidase
MASAGHGRSQAVFGSVTAEVLASMFGPVVVVGPNVDPGWDLHHRRLVIPIDGSPSSEQACGLGVAMSIELGLEPWVLTVDDPMVQLPEDVLESNYPARVARRLEAMSGHGVAYEVVRDEDPAAAIASFAERLGARLIVASTHGRTGFDRLRFGSVASDVVRRATCPVVLVKPPRFATWRPDETRQPAGTDESSPPATDPPGVPADGGHRTDPSDRHRQLLRDLERASVTLRSEHAPAFEALRHLREVTMADGAVPTRTKEELALMIAVSHRCDGCIAQHARAAAWEGATKREIAELLAVVWDLDPCAAASYAPRAWEAFLEFQREAHMANELTG